MAAPTNYTPEYCETVQASCLNKMTEIAHDVSEVHGAIFGERGLQKSTLSTSTLRWAVGVFLLPVVVAGLAIYAFYVSVPFIYAEKADLIAEERRVLVLEKATENLAAAVSKLPTSEQVKDIVLDAMKKYERDKRNGVVN